MVSETFEYYYDLGMQLRGEGRLGESEHHYRLALLKQPDHVDALFGLAESLHEQENFDEPISLYRRIIEINPGIAAVYNNLGNALTSKGMFNEAIIAYDKMLELEPTYVDGHLNRATALSLILRFDEAEQAIRHAISLEPDSFSAHFNLANTLQSMQRIDEAIELYKKAIEINPNFAGAYNNLGNTLKDIGRSSEAIAAFQKSLILEPETSSIYSNLGTVFSDSNEPQIAERLYRRALEIDPDNISAFSNLLYLQNYISGSEPHKEFQLHLEWGRRFDKFRRHGNNISRPEKPKPDSTGSGRIKVGYVSPDFHKHSVAYFFESLLSAHDKSRVEIYCYAEEIQEDEVTVRLRLQADHWRSIIEIDDYKVAEIIRQDGIDILVDMAGHTNGNRLRLFTHRAAPVQVSWLGYPNTTGLPAIDYRITDAVADPLGAADNLNAEKLIRLEGGFLCYRPDESLNPPCDPPCENRGFVTFGSFNNITKMTVEVIDAWAAILNKVKNSRLLIKSKLFRDENIRQKLVSRFTKLGIEDWQLMLVEHSPSYKEHMDLYNKIDIAIDTFPYNGTTTTCEALWMGVPVVTYSGNTHRSRVSHSILSRVGLNELVAISIESYVNIAVELASSMDRMRKIRSELRQAMRQSSLCNAAEFAENIENAYDEMINRKYSYSSR